MRLPEICIKAWDKAATPTNIRFGFRCTGIWPFDKNIFTEEDFMCCYVTDRTKTPDKESVTSRAVESPKPGPSKLNLDASSNFEKGFVSPYPKAPERN
ncbi:hypothetical protein ILUMI_09698 [Ignelater luminosus]|uniref:Uncharacterized protein n=1 Tax=Ignelater luminosus TaxID=2038154 RepID=A0A8K0D5B5_IGNLU|nr:hypothetical protein ILUMI_09698 [Ignelater luminosus]